MKKKQNKKRAFGVIVLGVFVVAMVLAVVGLSKTIEDIDVAVISHDPEAILASAGISEGRGVFLTASYVDKKADECVNMYEMKKQEALSKRQFEWTECGYEKKEMEQGMVRYELGDDYIPVARGGRLLANRGVKDLSEWFEAGDGTGYTGALKLDYQAEGAVFYFGKEEFYPLDKLSDNKGKLTLEGEDHNHLFTMSFAIPFTVMANGGENFEIVADDDTWVFMNDKLVIDMGGVHDAAKGRFIINEDGEVYAGVEDEEPGFSGVTLMQGDGAVVRIYHADRDSSSSVFKVRTAGMNLSVVDTKLANKDDGVLQVAYDPTDPTYVAPLGETTVVEPDKTKEFVLIATIEGVMVVVFAMLLMMMARRLVRQKLIGEK